MDHKPTYITTNMRFPTDLYMSLKREALEKRISFTALVHKKLSPKKASPEKTPEEMIDDLRKFTKKNAKFVTGNMTQAVIDMRYEQ